MRLMFPSALAMLLAGCELQLPEVPNESPVHSATQLMGKHEIHDNPELRAFLGVDPARTEWCAAFINAVLHANNIPGSNSVSQYPLTARSFLQWGETVNEPGLGDIVVFPRGNSDWEGHVGFYLMSSIIDGEEHYLILGGNQDDSVSAEYFPAKKALGIRRYIIE